MTAAAELTPSRQVNTIHWGGSVTCLAALDSIPAEQMEAVPNTICVQVRDRLKYALRTIALSCSTNQRGAHVTHSHSTITKWMIKARSTHQRGQFCPNVSCARRRTQPCEPLQGSPSLLRRYPNLMQFNRDQYALSSPDDAAPTLTYDRDALIFNSLHGSSHQRHAGQRVHALGRLIFVYRTEAGLNEAGATARECLRGQW